MKTQHFKQLLTVLALVAILTGCRKMNDEDLTPAYDQAQAEENFNDLQSIAEEAAENGTVSFKQEDALSGCATVTKDSTTQPGFVIATIDFGTGCTGPDGRTRVGKLIVTYNGPYKQQGTVIDIATDGYSVNGNAIEGTKHIVNNGYNGNGHLTWSVNANGTIQRTNGQTIAWTSQREREMLEGESSATLADDVYSVTGTATGSNSNGGSRTFTIIEPLIRKLAPGCRAHFVQGEVKIEVAGAQYPRYVDFGNGTCDDLAVVTINGHSRTIHLHH